MCVKGYLPVMQYKVFSLHKAEISFANIHSSFAICDCQPFYKCDQCISIYNTYNITSICYESMVFILQNYS